MKFRRQKRLDQGVNLTPLIDVVFLLLIFFMVTTTFTKQSKLIIKLPEASGEVAENSPQMLDLVVSAEGSYSLNGKNLINREIGTIMAALKQAAEGDITVPVRITADANARHQSVITAMDAAGRLGLEQLNIATQQPQEQK
jgi:biopolymer transport protein ExbD